MFATEIPPRGKGTRAVSLGTLLRNSPDIPEPYSPVFALYSEKYLPLAGQWPIYCFELSRGREFPTFAGPLPQRKYYSYLFCLRRGRALGAGHDFSDTVLNL